MATIESPVTGDAGTGASWIRLLPGTLGTAVPSLFAPVAELAYLGLAEIGAERVGTRDDRTPIPEATTIGASVWSRHDVDLVTVPGDQRLAGAAFDDPHPDAWWNPIHRNGFVVTFIGDPEPFVTNRPLTREWVTSLWVISFPLVVRAWNDGIGTARSDQL